MLQGLYTNSARTRIEQNSSYVTNVSPSVLGVKRQSTSFAATDSTNTSGTFDWSFLLAGVEKASYSTRAITGSLADLGIHDLSLGVSRTNSLEKYVRAAVSVSLTTFTSGSADVVLDLTAIGAGTFSNPLGDATIAGNGTTNFAYDFNDVSRPGLKIYMTGTYSGRINIIGLRGTLASPVRIQGPTSGQAVINSTNSGQPYCLQFTTGNQYIEIDGNSSSDEAYGIKFNGYKASATSGQMLFFSGSAQKGFSIHGCEFNGRKNDGDCLATGGGAAVQWQPPTPTITQNATNWSQEYVYFYNNYVHDNWGEGIYVGYFSDSEQAGYRPDRMGDVYIYDNIFEHTHRDGVQVASSNYCEIFRNTISYTGEEANASHISAVSWNDGNLTSYIYNNWVEETDLFMSGQNGGTGTGEYYIFCNYAKQRSTILAGSGNQFVYLSVDSANCNYHFFNNTLICPAVTVAPVAIQHNDVANFQCLDFTYVANVMSTGGTDQATWPELRRVNTPSDTTNWYISNTWVRTASEANLELDANYKPNARTSPAYGSGFDWSVRFVAVDFFGGQRDLEGFVLKTGNSPATGLGWTSGAYANHPIWIPDTTAPTISAGSISAITDTQFTINITTDENSTHYYVVVTDGASVPSKAQIIAGQNASGAAAIKSGNAAGKVTAQTPTGLTASTAYDIHVVAVDGSDNQSTINSEDATTTATTVQVAYVDAGAGVSRASSGTLTPAYPTGITSGDLLILHAGGRTSTIVVDDPGAGWELITNGQMGSSNTAQHYVYGKIADGTESGTLTVSFTNDAAVGKVARIFLFENNNATSVANAVESVGTSTTGTNTTITDVGVTSTVAKGLAVNFVGVADDNTVDAFTGQTGGTWVEAVAEFQYVATNGMTIQLQKADLTAAGTIDGGTYVMAASDPWGVLGFVIKP